MPVETSPLQNYPEIRQSEIPQQTETPFKQYPLPISPIKSINLRAPLRTLCQLHSPLPPSSGLNRMSFENDIFAISPSMFLGKTNRVDYLDILADADRKTFTSPIKAVQDHTTLVAYLALTYSPQPAESRDVAKSETAVEQMYDDDLGMKDGS